MTNTTFTGSFPQEVEDTDADTEHEETAKEREDREFLHEETAKEREDREFLLSLGCDRHN